MKDSTECFMNTLLTILILLLLLLLDTRARETSLPPFILLLGMQGIKEVSFGHGKLEVFNRTHAYWSWNRNQDDFKTVKDEVTENLFIIYYYLI